MMVINLPRDDLGILRLKVANAAKAEAPVTSIAATTSIARLGSQTAVPTPHNPVAERVERRRGERRQSCQRRGQARHAVVLLDTRSHYERRTRERRLQATDLRQHYRPLGVDVHI